jgi:hypothetical protein
MKNASECMSQINYRRLKRDHDNEAEFLKHTCVHRYHLNDRLIPIPVKSNELGQSLCLMCGKVGEGEDLSRSTIINESKAEKVSARKEFRLDGDDEKVKERREKVKFSYFENSFALTQQKMKY